MLRFMRPSYLLLLLVLTFHGLAFYTYQDRDQRLPDGDVMGHHGAIELFSLVSDDRGLFTAIQETVTAQTDYPPLFTLVNALPWHLFFADGAFPEGLWWIQFCGWMATFVFILLAGRHHFGFQTGLLAAILWSFFPLAQALGRQAMPEAWVGLCMAATLYAIARSEYLKAPLGTLFLAFTVLAGFLTKQTYAIYAFSPLLILLIGALRRNNPRRRLKNLLVGMALTLPLLLAWYLPQLETQSQYLSQSAGNRSGAAFIDHLLYYPAVLTGHGMGLIISLFFLPLTLVKWGDRRPQRLALVLQILGTLLLLILIPKKYPRMIIPLLPGLALLMAVATTHLWGRLKGGPQKSFTAFLGAAGLLLAVQTWALGPGLSPMKIEHFITYPAVTQRIDPNCFQRWIEVAETRPLHLDGISQSLIEVMGIDDRKAEPVEGQARILFLSEPPIPCDYQTTFSYRDHLASTLRRQKIDPGHIITATEDPSGALAQLQDHWLRLIISDQPWICAPASSALPVQSSPLQGLCPFRHQYADVEPLKIEASPFEATLYLYQRRAQYR